MGFYRDFFFLLVVGRGSPCCQKVKVPFEICEFIILVKYRTLNFVEIFSRPTKNEIKKFFIKVDNEINLMKEEFHWTRKVTKCALGCFFSRSFIFFCFFVQFVREKISGEAQVVYKARLLR